MRFKTYIFVKDQEGTKSKRESRKQVYLLGILCALIGIVFYLLEFGMIAFILIFIGSILYSVGKLVLLNTKDKGITPSNLLITDNEITLLNKTFQIEEMNDLSFNLVDYEGIPSWDQFKKPEGNANELSFLLNNKLVKMNFFIPSSKHYAELIDFLEEKKIKFQALKGFPWT